MRDESAHTLVASIRAEPRSFNRYTARDLTTEVITFLTQASLVRVDRVSGKIEPELAERWEVLAADGQSIDPVVQLIGQQGLHLRHLVEKRQSLEDLFIATVESAEPGVDRKAGGRQGRSPAKPRRGTGEEIMAAEPVE